MTGDPFSAAANITGGGVGILDSIATSDALWIGIVVLIFLLIALWFAVQYLQHRQQRKGGDYP